MSRRPTHHLTLTDAEVTLILCALEGYEPVYQHASKERCERLSGMIQRGCGISLDSETVDAEPGIHHAPERQDAVSGSSGGD